MHQRVVSVEFACPDSLIGGEFSAESSRNSAVKYDYLKYKLKQCRLVASTNAYAIDLVAHSRSVFKDKEVIVQNQLPNEEN